MNTTDPAGAPATTPTGEALASATTAERCLELAALAESGGDISLSCACLERAVALDRNCQAALLNLAALTLDQDDRASTFGLLEEAARVSALPEEIERLRTELFSDVREVPQLETYLRTVGRIGTSKAADRLSILVLAGEFPPGARSDSAKHLPALLRGLKARGHEVRVLTSAANPGPDADPAGPNDTADLLVLRSLQLADRGSSGGYRMRDNAERARTALAKSGANFVLALNLDGLDPSVLRPALDRRIPVLHWVAGARPPFAVEDLPADSHYWIAPSSDWSGTALRNVGCETARMDTLSPGVPMEQWFRLYLPDTHQLRICFVGDVKQGSGVDTLVRALGRLRAAGVGFSAEIAGEVSDSGYFAEVANLAGAEGITDGVRFVGRLDDAGQAALFARSNVLVSPGVAAGAYRSTPVEAMASGLVMVSTGLGGERELVREISESLLFAAGDDADLASKLSALAGGSETWAHWQRRAQAAAMNSSVERAVAGIETRAADMHAALEADAMALPELEASGADAPVLA